MERSESARTYSGLFVPLFAAVHRLLDGNAYNELHTEPIRILREHIGDELYNGLMNRLYMTAVLIPERELPVLFRWLPTGYMEARDQEQLADRLRIYEVPEMIRLMTDQQMLNGIPPLQLSRRVSNPRGPPQIRPSEVSSARVRPRHVPRSIRDYAVNPAQTSESQPRRRVVPQQTPNVRNREVETVDIDTEGRYSTIPVVTPPVLTQRRPQLTTTVREEEPRVRTTGADLGPSNVIDVDNEIEIPHAHRVARGADAPDYNRTCDLCRESEPDAIIVNPWTCQHPEHMCLTCLRGIVDANLNIRLDPDVVSRVENIMPCPYCRTTELSREGIQLVLDSGTWIPRPALIPDNAVWQLGNRELRDNMRLSQYDIDIFRLRDRNRNVNSFSRDGRITREDVYRWNNSNPGLHRWIDPHPLGVWNDIPQPRPAAPPVGTPTAAMFRSQFGENQRPNPISDRESYNQRAAELYRSGVGSRGPGWLARNADNRPLAPININSDNEDPPLFPDASTVRERDPHYVEMNRTDALIDTWEREAPHNVSEVIVREEPIRLPQPLTADTAPIIAETINPLIGQTASRCAICDGAEGEPATHGGIVELVNAWNCSASHADRICRDCVASDWAAVRDPNVSEEARVLAGLPMSRDTPHQCPFCRSTELNGTGWDIERTLRRTMRAPPLQMNLTSGERQRLSDAQLRERALREVARESTTTTMEVMNVPGRAAEYQSPAELYEDLSHQLRLAVNPSGSNPRDTIHPSDVMSELIRQTELVNQRLDNTIMENLLRDMNAVLRLNVRLLGLPTVLDNTRTLYEYRGRNMQSMQDETNVVQRGYDNAVRMTQEAMRNIGADMAVVTNMISSQMTQLATHPDERIEVLNAMPLLRVPWLWREATTLLRIAQETMRMCGVALSMRVEYRR